MVTYSFPFSFSRLASDLLLWEPMAPSPADRPDLGGFNIGTGLDLASQILRAQGPDRFVMCRSGLRSYDDGNCLISSMFWFIILYYHCYRNLKPLSKRGILPKTNA